MKPIWDAVEQTRYEDINQLIQRASTKQDDTNRHSLQDKASERKQK